MQLLVFKKYLTLVLCLAAFLVIAACSSSSNSSPVPTTTIGGSVFAAPVAGASVIVKDASGSTIAGPVNTVSDGTYSIAIPTSALSSDLRIESSAGTFTDEATGITTAAGTLAAYVSGETLTTGSSVNLDPASTIVYGLVTGQGKTLANASTLFSGACGFTPDISVMPTAASSGMAGSSSASRYAGLFAAAVSRVTKDLGLTPDKQFDLIAALAQDLADGKLDGMNGTSTVTMAGMNMPADILTRIESALDAASRAASTATYRVEYLPGMMAASQGKTTFTVKITKQSDGSAVTGLVASNGLMLMPLMHMPTDEHATPVDTAIVDNNDGTYTCTVYYLMASVMNGKAMGYWELQVMIGDMMGGMTESAYFYPMVGMAMGDTPRATLKGVNDLIAGMTGTENRSYYLFNDGPNSIVSGITFTFNIFLAAKESMMNYPAISTRPTTTTTLHDQNGSPWTVNSVVLSAMTVTTWIPAVENAPGHWSIPGLSPLMSGTTGTVYVKLSINGEQKTTNGMSVSADSNDFAVFTVTPKSGM